MATLLAPSAPAQGSAPMWAAAPQPAPPTNGFAAFAPAPATQQNNTFVSEANFSNVFNNTDSTGELHST